MSTSAVYSFSMFVILHTCANEAMVSKDQHLNTAKINELPFVVSISRDTRLMFGAPEAYHKCTGTLISSLLVLTAAHCFRNIKDYNTFVVKVGSPDLRSTVIHEIDRWITYNEWLENQVINIDKNTFHDIAIVKLRTHVNSDIKIAKVSTVSDNDLQEKEAITAGWGKTNDEEKPKDLHIAHVHVLKPEECLFNNIYIDSIDDNVKNGILCTNSESMVCLKEGDSGGPLLINKKKIIGVNIGDCFQNLKSDLPKFQNIHSSIDFYRDFINDILRDF